MGFSFQIGQLFSISIHCIINFRPSQGGNSVYPGDERKLFLYFPVKREENPPLDRLYIDDTLQGLGYLQDILESPGNMAYNMTDTLLDVRRKT